MPSWDQSPDSRKGVVQTCSFFICGIFNPQIEDIYIYNIYIYPPFQPCLTWMRMNRKLPKRVNRPTNKFQLNLFCHSSIGEIRPSRVGHSNSRIDDDSHLLWTCEGSGIKLIGDEDGVDETFKKFIEVFWGENYRDVFCEIWWNSRSFGSLESTAWNQFNWTTFFFCVFFVNWVLWSPLFTSGMLGSAIVSSDGGNDIAKECLVFSWFFDLVSMI